MDVRTPPARFDKTVLQVIPTLDAGGAERTTVDVARAVCAAGGVAIVASRGGRLEDKLRDAGAELVRLPMDAKDPLTLARNVGRLAALARARNVDIVHARSRAPAWSALGAARAVGAAFVTTYHGSYKAHWAGKRLYNSVMARGDAVIANSGFTAEAIRQTYAIDPARIVVIPRGVDLAAFSPEAVSSDRVEALRAAWGLTNDGPIIMLPARLSGWKGHSVAIRAFARLVDRPGCAEARLLCVGDADKRGDFARSLRAEADALKLGERIAFVGHCDDMPAAFSLCDFAITPSTRPEAFGRTAAEAGAMARPVIAADHGGARETVEDGVTGALAPPGDVVGLAEAMEAFVNAGPEARATIGARARAKISRSFSVEAMCAATLRAYVNVKNLRRV